jgi:hypothetical protein
MKPFKLIQGSSHNISKFEDEVAQAIEEGYEFSSDMISKLVENSHNKSEVLFFQPMTIEEHLEFENEDLDYNDNDEDVDL